MEVTEGEFKKMDFNKKKSFILKRNEPKERDAHGNMVM